MTVLWLGFSLYNSMVAGGSRRHQSVNLPTQQTFSVSQVETVVFGLFALASLLLLGGVGAFAIRFRKADIDVLFPTPISVKWIIYFRFIRDSLATTILPIFFLIFVPKTSQMSFKNLVDTPNGEANLGQVFRMAYLSWFLISLGFTAVNFAAGFYLNRAEVKSERVKKLYGRSVLVFGILMIGGVAYNLYINPSFEMAKSMAHSWFWKLMFLPATLCTNLTMAPLTGNWMPAIITLLVIGGMIGIGLHLAIKQQTWVYDIASMSASTSGTEILELQRQGDISAVWAAKARSGQIKSKRWNWWYERKWSKEWAVVWREGILFRRIGIMQVALILTIYTVFTIALTLGAARLSRATSIVDFMYVFSVSQLTLMNGMVSGNGFTELLRRADLVKPLPFSSARLILFEVLAKVLIGILGVVLYSLFFVIFQPSKWLFFPVGVVASLGAMVFITSTYCIVNILFPDRTDPTQRGFLGLIQMLAMLVTIGPLVAIYLGSYFWQHSIPIALLSTCVISFPLGALAAHIAGQQYANFNPTD